MNINNWCDIKNVMKFLITSNNNLNPYTHSLYYEIRDKIKNKLDIKNYKSLLCNRKDEVKDIELELDLTELDLTDDDDDNNLSNELIICDPRGFCNDKQYKINKEDNFYKQDLVENLFNISNKPVIFLNSLQYNDNEINDEDELTVNYDYIKSLIDYNIKVI